jgi:hypothetical protein
MPERHYDVTEDVPDHVRRRVKGTIDGRGPVEGPTGRAGRARTTSCYPLLRVLLALLDIQLAWQ